MNARIVVEGEEWKHYNFKGKQAADHSRIALEHEEGGDIVQLVIAKPAPELLAAQAKDWSLVVDRDFRASAFMTIVKAAYLTLFKMFGYRYALSASGLAIGRAILGQFYEENYGKPVAETRNAARAFLRPHQHMLRPVVSFGGPAPRGTIEDGRAAVCFGSCGRPFALVVWVRIDEDLYAVLMPDIKHPDSAEAYATFLIGDREYLYLNEAVYKTEAGHWEVSDKTVRTDWPKTGDGFDLE